MPLQIAETAADVALLASLAAQEGSETVRGDAWAAAALAEAATVSAAQLVHVNLATIETHGGGSARCMLAELH